MTKSLEIKNPKEIKKNVIVSVAYSNAQNTNTLYGEKETELSYNKKRLYVEEIIAENDNLDIIIKSIYNKGFFVYIDDEIYTEYTIEHPEVDRTIAIKYENSNNLNSSEHTIYLKDMFSPFKSQTYTFQI